MEKYVKLEVLGHGTYGSVILVKSMDKKKVSLYKKLVRHEKDLNRKR